MNWYYQEDGLQVGPLTEDEFDTRVKVGRIDPSTMVWNESMTGWTPFGVFRDGPRSQQPLLPLVACSQCLRQFPQTDMIQYQNSWICASCKPLFFQMLREGGRVAGEYEYGQFWPRVGAKLIDGLIMMLVFGVFVGLNAVLALAFPDTPFMQGLFTILFYPIYFAVGITYSAYFLTKHGATPGKMAFGLRVMNADDGNNISVPKAIGRYFAEKLNPFMCYVGYLMAAFDDQRRTLHDRLCNTLVVKK